MPEIQDYHYQGSLQDDPKRRLNSFFTKFGTRKIGGLLATLIMAVMLPVTIIALSQQQNFKQQASEEWKEIKVIDVQVGKDAAGVYYRPSLIAFNNSLYVFVIGQGQEKCPVQDNNDPNCNRSEWYNVYVTSSNNPEQNWDALKNIGGNASSSPVAHVMNEQLLVTIKGYDAVGTGTNEMFYQTQRTGGADFVGFPGSWSVTTAPTAQESSSLLFNGNEYKVETTTGTVKIFRKN